MGETVGAIKTAAYTIACRSMEIALVTKPVFLDLHFPPTLQAAIPRDLAHISRR